MLTKYIRLTALLVSSLGTYLTAADEDESTPTQESEADSEELATELTKVTVIVENVKVDEGPVYLQFFEGETAYNEGRGTLQSVLEPKSDSVELAVDVKPGEYSIAVYQDKNEDGELNRNFMGIPREPWGMSNNAPARFGPPKWSDMRFEVRDTEVEQRIELQ